MDRQIPYLFNSVIISSPQQISESNPNIGRAKVKVFTKYGNRNGSYITDAVANQLIESAPNCPVVGFFDQQSGDWSSHVGPKLASAYGYVEKFEGWEPASDSDGIERDYATFSVVLFSDYFDEAKNIVGKSQSMELDINSIDGDWAPIEGNEYFVYTKAKMHGFCVLGSDIEPCFSSSVFFSKEDEGKTQFEKLSQLLFDLKAKVEEIEGGEAAMEEIKNTEVVEEVSTDFEEVQEQVVEQQEEEVVQEVAEEFSENVEEAAEEVAAEEVVASEFDNLQSDYETLQASYNELQTNYEALMSDKETITSNFEAEINGLKENVTSLEGQLAAANEKIASYEAIFAEQEKARKDELIETYAEVISDEEISEIKNAVDNFSYEELESKLAVVFAHNNLRKEKKEGLRAPLPQPEESDFARLMKNYKR